MKASTALTASDEKQVVVHEHRYVNVPQGAASGAAATPTGAAEAETVQAVVKKPFDPMEHRFQIESAFDEDKPPTVESRKLEGTILRNLASPAGKGASVKSLDCKATRCRLEITFDNGETDKSVIRDVFMRSKDMDVAGTVVERTTGPDGKVRALIYLSPGRSRPEN